MDSKAKKPGPANEPADDIDLELVLIDPVYRRKVIEALNAAPRPAGGARDGGARGRRRSR